MSGLALALVITGALVIRGALKGLNPVESFQDIFDRSKGGVGIPARISGGGFRTFPGGTTGATTGQTFSPNVERWRGLVGAHFPPGHVDDALSVMHCESRGNPNAMHPISRASGLFQHLPKFWDSRSRQAGIPGANIMDPVANVTVAAWLFKQSNTWDHWSCKPSVTIQSGQR
jgi:hypothetical protein